MKIGVLSDTRVPTLAQGHHGLGRMAHDIARALAGRGHEVTLYAGPGSEFAEGKLRTHDNERSRPAFVNRFGNDAWLDLSHYHDLSLSHQDWPVVNYMMDLECPYRPQRVLAPNTYMQRKYGGRVVKIGVDLSNTRLDDKQRSFVAYAARLHPAKGVDLAQQVAARIHWPVYFAGHLHIEAPPTYVGVFDEQEAFHGWLSSAVALLHPAREDAGGRVLIEAAALGTPSLVLDTCGNADHVEHCVSGFICADVNELAEAIYDVRRLDRQTMRDWALSEHSMDQMIDGIEAALQAAVDGEMW